MIRRWWPLAVLLLSFSPRAARAEAQPLTSWVGGQFTVFINRPTVATDGWRIDCPASNPNCLKLNKLACNDDSLSLPISFTLNRSASGSGAAVDATTTRTVYAFVSKSSNCIYSDVSAQTGYNPNFLIGKSSSLPQSSVFYSGGTRAFEFPRDLDPGAFNEDVTAARTTGVFTTRELLRALGLCSVVDGTDTNLSTYFLCVAMDSTSKAGVNTTGTSSASTSSTDLTGLGTTTSSGGGDPTAFLQLQADTLPPAAPQTVTVKPRNGRAEIEVAYDTAALDVYELRVHYTDDAANLAAAAALDEGGTPVGCAAWTQNVQTQSTVVRNEMDGNRTFVISGLRNDVDYGFCSTSTDYLGNVSAASPTAIGRPRFECDLFECYPDTLETGFCGAGSQRQIWGGVLGLGIAVVGRSRRRRRQQIRLRKLPRPQGLQRTSRPPRHRQDPVRAQRLRPRCWRLLLPLWLLAALVGTTSPAPARAADGGNRPYSEPPVGSTQSRPAGVEGDDPVDERRGEAPHPHLSFGDPAAESLTYAAPAVRRPRFGVEARLMPYRPKVGSAEAQALYDLVYVQGGSSIFPGRPLLYALGFEWFALNRLGLFGPYVRVAYWQATGATRICTAGDGAEIPCTAATVRTSQRGNDNGWLGLVPLTVGAVWRLDPLLQRLHLPMGAAVNVGLDWVLWWANSGGRRARINGRRAQGATVGLHVGGQLSLQLDALVRRHPPSGTRVAATHLFVDYQYSQGEALWGRRRANRLNTHDRYMLALGLGVRFF